MQRNERRRLNYAIRRDYPVLEEQLPAQPDPRDPVVEEREQEAEIEEGDELLEPGEQRAFDELPDDGFYVLDDDDFAVPDVIPEERDHMEEEQEEDWMKRFRDFVVKSNMPQATTKGLLEILREKVPELPRDHRVFLGTSNWKPVVHERPEGAYGFYSLQNFIEKTNWLPPLDNLVLQFNCDGIPIFKSSNEQTWILSSRLSHPYSSKPVPLAIFSGTAKPDVDFLFSRFTPEAEILCRRGVKMCFIFDAPARAMVKGIIGHMGRLACERCKVRGVHDGRRMTFPSSVGEARTGLQLRNPVDENERGHRPRMSPLLHVQEINLVSDFLLDSLHLLYLGITRKLVFMWSSGPLQTRLGPQNLRRVSARLRRFRDYIPSVFSLSLRSLTEVRLWKGVEFRFFLLYGGVVALKDIMPLPMYQNFLLLSCAVRCLESNFSNETAAKLDLYITSFIQHAEQLYTSAFMTYNSHSILHIGEDYRLFGNLSFFTALPFESFLFQMKRRVRRGQNIVSQLMMRIREQGCDSFEREVWRDSFSPVRDIYYEIQGQVFQVEEWSAHSATGVFWRERAEFLLYPEPWSKFGVYVFRRKSNRVVCLDRNELVQRLMCLPTDGGRSIVCFPIMKNTPS